MRKARSCLDLRISATRSAYRIVCHFPALTRFHKKCAAFPQPDLRRNATRYKAYFSRRGRKFQMFFWPGMGSERAHIPHTVCSTGNRRTKNKIPHWRRHAGGPVRHHRCIRAWLCEASQLQEKKYMSEQAIQESLYSISVAILDKYACLSLGATNCFIRTVFRKRRQMRY